MLESTIWAGLLAYKLPIFCAIVLFVLFRHREDLAGFTSRAWSLVPPRNDSAATPGTEAALNSFAALKAHFHGNQEATKALKALWPFFLDDEVSDAE